jgi:DNA-binding MarR family transcriptional regulator
LYIFDFLWGFNGFIYAWAAADIVTTATAVLLGIPLFKEIDLFANATAKVKREKIMQDTIKKELVRLIFRSKNIGLRFPAAIGGSAGGAGNVPDINMAEAALMKGIADETLGSEGAKIQEALCINKAAVSQMLGVLERKGYISRETNRDNRRKIILTLTAKGHKAVQDTGRTVDALLSEIINRFGKNDTEQFIRQFNRFADIVAELIKQPEP